MLRNARGVRGERVVEDIGDELESRVGVLAPRAGETFSTTGELLEHFRPEESGDVVVGRQSLRGGVEAAGRDAAGVEVLDVVITMGAALVGC